MYIYNCENNKLISDDPFELSDFKTVYKENEEYFIKIDDKKMKLKLSDFEEKILNTPNYFSSKDLGNNVVIFESIFFGSYSE